MATNQGKLFPPQEEVVEKTTIAPKEKAKVEERKEKKSFPQVVEKTASCNVNIRHEPNLSATIFRVLNKGEKIKVVDSKDEWLKTADGYFIMGKYLH